MNLKRSTLGCALIVFSVAIVWILTSPLSAAAKIVPPGESKEVQVVVEAFFQAMKKGNLSQAFYAYTSEDFRKITNFVQFKRFVDGFPSLGQIASYEIGEPDHYESLGSVDVLTTSADHKENMVSVDVVWEAGKWRILGLQIYPKEVFRD